MESDGDNDPSLLVIIERDECALISGLCSGSPARDMFFGEEVSTVAKSLDHSGTVAQ